MNHEDYVARIAGASPLELVIIQYELILEQLDKALGTEQRQVFEQRIDKAKAFLMELMKSLNMDYAISKELMACYIRMNGQLSKAFFSGSKAQVESVIRQLNMLLSSWRTLKEQDKEAPVMENTQQLYAGLTYRDGKLAEYIPEDNSRGFKA